MLNLRSQSWTNNEKQIEPYTIEKERKLIESVDLFGGDDFCHTNFFPTFQRINVMSTRAKSLLIIIGDEQTLAENKDWRDVITYCHENQSVIYGEFYHLIE